LAAYPDHLASAAHGAAMRPTPAGEWTPAEVVRHLIAVEIDVHQARLLDVAINDGTKWAWTEPRPWPGEPDLDLDGVLERFAAMRAVTVATVQALDSDGWARSGIHATYGRLDVGGLLRLAIDHDEDHLRSLEATG
jgi:DinB superfamily